ncbi:O-methyltransferase [Vibrio maritimus]|uniref:O-methyltransferase n=1 Tax=Vibrio maritimus TaxID=990268 RepID=UPI001F4903F4|nr:O-methyltransferase [Vibrio maritimus]
MTNIKALLNELETKGIENDLHVAERRQKYLNITKGTGEFLSVMAKSIAATRILEVGTSNGYSTIWLASALNTQGHVTTIEYNLEKVAEARENFAQAGLEDRITLMEGDATQLIPCLEKPFDLVFLDAERDIYPSIIENIIRLTRPGGLIVCDNAISHQEELTPIMEYFCHLDGFTTHLVPVGKGEFVIHKGTAVSAS